MKRGVALDRVRGAFMLGPGTVAFQAAALAAAGAAAATWICFLCGEASPVVLPTCASCCFVRTTREHFAAAMKKVDDPSSCKRKRRAVPDAPRKNLTTHQRQAMNELIMAHARQTAPQRAELCKLRRSRLPPVPSTSAAAGDSAVGWA